MSGHFGKKFFEYPSTDKMGFALPVSPSHSLQLLNNYMRTDLLRALHHHLHCMKDNDEPGSPLHHLAKSLTLVIDSFDKPKQPECVGRNPFHVDPSYVFNAEKDFLHDMELMKHHLNCHQKTLQKINCD